MGAGGTEVAKEAADMVLTDDDFGTIEAAVEEGRGVFDNLSKFIVWTLPTNMAEGLVILVAIALGVALPILPTQILWINMTTAVLLGLTLAFEPKEPGIMRRPPRDPDRPLLTGALVARILLLSALMVAATWWLFEWERGRRRLRWPRRAPPRSTSSSPSSCSTCSAVARCTAPVRPLGCSATAGCSSGWPCRSSPRPRSPTCPLSTPLSAPRRWTSRPGCSSRALAVAAWAVVALDKRLRRRII